MKSFLGQRPYHPCPGAFSISIDALEMGLRFPLHSNQHYYMALMDQVHDVGRVITSLDNKSEILWEEIQKVKDGGNPNVVASVEQWAAEAQALVDNLKAELEEVI
ncbi:hypothetical protein B296_00040216 [Ensete ventricosum]|uniref:Uncharacterized protein n=1 Tax=Ensete ventricosum TaxID=4639 RepID=A0A426YRM3_ENSVE|nr:hypothetical protein B296_00040216 [Ensete ventricosum]